MANIHVQIKNNHRYYTLREYFNGTREETYLGTKRPWPKSQGWKNLSQEQVQLSQNDKRRVARKLFQDGTHKVASLAKLLSVTTRFVNKWTSDIRKEREKTRNEQILDLYLEGWTEAEIGKKLKLAVSTISTILTDFKKRINSQIEIPDPSQIGDVWLFINCDDAYGISGFPGRIPGQIVENLLHFYTKPFDKVAGILGVARQTIDLWEGTSIANPSNTCNPPDLRIKAR